MSSMTTPHISVLIDTYNHERYIEQAIVSVLEQDFPREEMEIVVVDDGSTDSTPSIIEKFLPSASLHTETQMAVKPLRINATIPELSGPHRLISRRRRLVGESRKSVVAETFEAESRNSGRGSWILRGSRQRTGARDVRACEDLPSRFEQRRSCPACGRRAHVARHKPALGSPRNSKPNRSHSS